MRQTSIPWAPARRRPSIRRIVAAVAVLGLTATACGSDDEASGDADEETTDAGNGDTGTAGPIDDGAAIPEATGPADDSLDPVVVG